MTVTCLAGEAQHFGEGEGAHQILRSLQADDDTGEAREGGDKGRVHPTGESDGGAVHCPDRHRLDNRRLEVAGRVAGVRTADDRTRRG